MRNKGNISNQKGTLLVEAIAMLALIAMVTPTLYKKSSERLQEIQDINTASQARTMNSIVETFIKANYSALLEATSSSSGVLGGTIELSYLDNGVECPGGAGKCFDVGYSAYVPFGYTPGELKNYSTPRVYVHRDKDSLISYVVYPSVIDPGRKRASRIASLVGANGGTVMNTGGGSSVTSAIYGTGGAWGLENEMLEEINMSSLVDNSLVVTSTEPITMSDMDSEKFLYRVPPEAEGNAEDYYHNTMVTDLYMGGHIENTQWASHAEDYYSIFNVRKLTLNTNCSRHLIGYANSSSSGVGIATCDPTVADLYVGKPIYPFSGPSDKSPGVGNGNTGAAWIYGNLSALKENFKLFRENDSGYERASGYDVMQFARVNESSLAEEVVVFRAENETGSARVGMMDNFVQVFESGSTTGGPTFMVGSAGNGGEGGFIQAAQEGEWHMVRLNSPDQLDPGVEVSSYITYINRKGGAVFINGDTSGSTFINDGGGLLEVGKEGSWIRANGVENNAELHLLVGKDMEGLQAGLYDNRVFTVGSNNMGSDYMLRADNSIGPNAAIGGGNSRTALRGGRLRVYSSDYTADDDRYGGSSMILHLEGDGGDVPAELNGVTAVLSRFTDILGSTYLGSKAMEQNASTLVDGNYDRRWTLGVAGSAWVDDMLWARHAWFRDSGFKELHAGYSSYSDYKNGSKAAWLNVYDDGIIVRDRVRAEAQSSLRGFSSDVMMEINSSKVYMTDLGGAKMELADNVARIGTDNNFFYATDGAGVGDNSSAVHMVGSSIANIYTTDETEGGKVDIQKGAMIFRGQPDALDVSSTIEATTDRFTIVTSDRGDLDEHAQVMVNNDEMRLRYINFTVDHMHEGGSSTTRFKVVPEGLNVSDDDANVQVRGTFHVTGNDLIHIAPNLVVKSEGDSSSANPHAVFELDPEYLQVWAKRDRTGSFTGRGGSSTTEYQAMFRINPYDVGGGVSDTTHTGSASVYIRKGAIELEESTARDGDVGYGADEGYGYIMANRLVSNVTGDNGTVPTVSATGYEGRGNEYDRYMVNPAYTSVMHDIKLTTRGGARLSDILPDYVLKGVYNLINNCAEGDNSVVCPVSNTGTDKWASPYIGQLPYASCPPGYRNLATVIPLSFNVGRAGDLVKETKESGAPRWVVNERPRQARIMEKVLEAGVGDIAYPNLQEVSSITFNAVYNGASSFSGDFNTLGMKRAEGWFFGFDAMHPDASGSTNLSAIDPAPIAGDISQTEGYTPWTYMPNTNTANKYAVAEPLYFQQNTWLKTTVDPTDNAWNAYMGFIYDTTSWPAGLGGSHAPVRSNYNIKGYNDSSATGAEYGVNYVWNLFPIPINTLEGHATVYCYFDRSQFGGDWGNLVDPVDQLAQLKDGSPRGVGEKTAGSNSAYVERLNDPSLKYNDPW